MLSAHDSAVQITTLAPAHRYSVCAKMEGMTYKPDELSERSIYWLLYFLGFSSVRMDGTERLLELETSAEIGSLDILAHELRLY